MYIHADKDQLKAITLPNMDDTAEFSENNIAQVKESDGDVLLNEHPDIFTEHNNDN